MRDPINLNAIVKQKRMTTAQWELENPILPNGLFGIEITEDGKHKLKAGDGKTTWNDLEYLSGGGSGGGGIYLTYEQYLAIYDEGLDSDNIYEVGLTEEQYEELLNNDKIPSDESGIIVHFYTDGEEEASITPSGEGGCNVNLLRNPNFFINQRGNSMYDGISGTYTVDRWKLDNDEEGQARLTILSNNGISLESLSGEYYGVCQTLEVPLIAGQVYSISAKINGKIVSANIMGRNYSEEVTLFPNSNYYFHYIFNERLQQEEIYIRVLSEDFTSIILNWVKLEIGIAATSYVDPDPWDELVHCGVPDDTSIFGYHKKITDADKLDGKHASEFANTEGSAKQAAVGTDGFIAYPETTTLFAATDSILGRIKIKLPVYFDNTMVKFKVSIYDNRANESVDYIVSGHSERGSAKWTNTSAVCIGPRTSNLNNLNVRFSRSNNTRYITIGDLDTMWSYPLVKISDVVVGFHKYDYSSWYTGWEIDIVTEDASIVDSTINNTWIGDNVNPNIAFNPNFKINQRGLQVYGSNYHNTVDRWLFNGNGDDTLEVVEDGVKLTAADPDRYRPYISQLIEKEVVGDGVYTLSVCIDGEVYYATADLYQTESYSGAIVIDAPNILIGMNYVAEKSLYRIYIQTSVEKPSFTVNWVKLEPGYTCTSFMTPDYALELIRCRRYFRTEPVCITSVRTNVMIQVVEFNNTIETPMRIKPSIIVYGVERNSTNYQSNKVRMSNGSVEQVLNINKTYTIPDISTYTVGVDIPSSMVATNTFTMQAVVALDAELYL